MWCIRYTGNYEYTMNTNAALLECYGFSLLDRVEGVFTQVSVRVSNALAYLFYPGYC